MFYATWKIDDGVLGGLFYTPEDFYDLTFSPDIEDLQIVNFKLIGQSYGSRKSQLRKLADDFKYQIIKDNILNCYEIGYLTRWLSEKAAQYGLVREFKKLGIC